MKYFVYGEDRLLTDRVESVHADSLEDLGKICVKTLGLVRVFVVLTEAETKVARKRAKSVNKML